MTKEEFIAAFTDQKISVYTPTVPEREALMAFLKMRQSFLVIRRTVFPHTLTLYMQTEM